MACCQIHGRRRSSGSQACSHWWQKWHSACQDSRLVEEIWPNTMRIAIFTYRTELPVFPRGYCALIHRASHRLPDGRTQLVITDRSVSHPAMPASRHFIFMTVYPSGMLITPVQQGERTVSHVAQPHAVGPGACAAAAIYPKRSQKRRLEQ